MLDDDEDFMLDEFVQKNGDSRSDYIGQRIVAARFGKKALVLSLENGKRMSIRDRMQRCCEVRHISTDDDVSTLVGQRFRHVKARAVPNLKDEEDYVHEAAFVEVAGDLGFVTLVTHNEHNGYYSGFGLVIDDLLVQ